MLETNIRLVLPGADVSVSVRRLTANGPDLSPELIQKAANALRYRHGLAAVPISDGAGHLLVATDRSLPLIEVAGDDWILELVDSGSASQDLTLENALGRRVIPDLIERAIGIQLGRTTDLRTINSPRIWYEPRPFKTEYGLNVHRGYEVDALLIEDEGVGIAVDVRTAFFTSQTLAWYFDPNVRGAERQQRRAQFDELTRRQTGQKGTLIYDVGHRLNTCYFESAPDRTCGTTGSIQVNGQRFGSLLEYSQFKHPHIPISADTPAIRVSFSGLDRPQFVAADRLRARVMNDDVPSSISSIDKIAPHQRRSLINEFWKRLALRPLGGVAPGVHKEFWRPPQSRAFQMPIPDLTFGKGRTLKSPHQRTAHAYRSNLRDRRDFLARHGSYSVPLTMDRTIYCAYPRRIGENVAEQLASDVASAIKDATGLSLQTDLVAYDTIRDAVASLQARDECGTVLLILNEDPAAYHEAAFWLSGWRVKRVTEKELCGHYRVLKQGWRDKRTGQTDLIRGERRWKEFVSFNALGLLQLLDVIPYRCEQAGPYEAQLAIDVGYDRRHVALSLLIARDDGRTPSFRLETHVETKVDHKHEEINPVILSDKIVELLESALRHPCASLASLLVIRDGRLGKEEFRGIEDAISRLKVTGKVAVDARVDIVELRKDTSACVRFWELEQDGMTFNPLEGTAIRIDADRVLIATTGVSTLTQGTADPLLLVSSGQCESIVDAAAAVFASAQLNWASPAVPQKLPISLKRTDEELTARAAQEIRRLR